MNILILTSDSNCRVVQELRENKNINVDTSCVYSDISKKHDVVFAHNYNKIIPVDYFTIPKVGIFILHSTDLPRGRGWAPIYYSISNQEELYTISLLKISNRVDKGNILMKLKIKKPKIITNLNLRDIDESGILLLILKFIELYKSGAINSKTIGVKQDEKNATYNKKRTPLSNILDINKTIRESIYEILATNVDYPAFIEINGERLSFTVTSNKYYTLNELDKEILVMI